MGARSGTELGPIDLPEWFDVDDDATPIAFLDQDAIRRMCADDESGPDETNAHVATRAAPDTDSRAAARVHELLAAFLADDV